MPAACPRGVFVMVIGEMTIMITTMLMIMTMISMLLVMMMMMMMMIMMVMVVVVVSMRTSVLSPFRWRRQPRLGAAALSVFPAGPALRQCSAGARVE
jgi:hypothetical protein